MGDSEIQHYRHRARLIGEVSLYLNVSTMLTPALNNLLSFNLVRSAEQVSDLIN